MSTTTRPGRLRTAGSAVRVVLAAGLLLYMARAGFFEWNAAVGLATTRRIWVLAIPVLVLVALLMAQRLCIIWRAAGLVLPFATSLRLTLIGGFFSTFLPGSSGGDIVRMYYAAASNRSRAIEVTTLLLLDRAVGLLAVFLLPLFALAFAPHHVWSSAVVSLWVAFAAAASALLIAGFYWATRASGDTVEPGAVEGTLQWVVHLRRVIRTLRRIRHARGTVARALGLSLASQAGTVAVIVLLVTTLDAPGSIYPLLALTPLGLLVMVLPLTPGGLGVGEGTFEVLVAAAGSSAGAEAILVWRVLTTAVDLSGAVLFALGKTDFGAAPEVLPALGQDE